MHHRIDLIRIATEAMQERELRTGFSPQALQELQAIQQPAQISAPGQGHAAPVADLRNLPWCSIDNDDSLDLDQLSCIEAQADGRWQVRVAVADVDALVKKGSALDQQAQVNGATVYTSACIFPMLPERLSTDLCSLNAAADRLALVTCMTFSSAGQLEHYALSRALVRNQAKLAYDAVSAWLGGDAELPPAAAQVPGMDQQLRQQDQLAQQLRLLRRGKGSLELETFAPRAEFSGEKVVAIRQQVQNRARQLIEELMVATNQCNARFLQKSGASAIRRVVRTPERWPALVALARRYGELLPAEPDGPALEAFLARRHQADPLRFADLSLVVVKLLGSGEYVVEVPGQEPIGHFGLALRDYAHSTAPNRRFPDLVPGRLLKAALAGLPAPYSTHELAALAQHCTRQEDAVRKIERRMRKSDAALYLENRIGEEFDAIVTGNSLKGLWVRLLEPPIEGKLQASSAPPVGTALRVALVATDVERGFIDFERVTA